MTWLIVALALTFGCLFALLATLILDIQGRLTYIEGLLHFLVDEKDMDKYLDELSKKNGWDEGMREPI